MRRYLAALLLLSLCSTALAQRAVILQLPGGQLLGVAYTSAGPIVLTDVQIIRLENPTPPPPVTSGRAWLVVVRGTQIGVDQAQVLSDLREWSDQQAADKVSHLVFARGQVGPDGSVDARAKVWVDRVPASATLPYAFVAQPRQDGKVLILWHGPLTAKAEDLIVRVKEVLR
jgi:hypothetical protein